MAAKFTLEIYTPYRLFFAAEAEAFVIMLSDGEAGIYAGHARFTAPVAICSARIKNKNGVWKTAFINGGIIEVKRHKTVLLTEAAEWPEEIDRERALTAKQKALDVLKDRAFHFESAAAKLKLQRAEMRLKVYEQRS
jgi:F-type H+-transporting ATPase subunit epsilon